MVCHLPPALVKDFMKFSIITPSFRNSNWLKLCIASVADQQGVSLEHIVQDSCSDDGTQDWLPQDRRVQAFIEKDKGMYDAVNRTESAVIAAEGNQTQPDISGNRVVWADDRDGTYNIGLYDLTSKKESIVSTGKGEQIEPKINGDKIVWMDKRSGDFDVYMYDIASGKGQRARLPHGLFHCQHKQ